MLESLKIQLVKLLRWSERYTKTDMLYLTKGGFWLVLGHIIQIASGLVLAVAFANLLPKETFGTYQFIMSMAVIISAFTLTGMGTAITRAVAQGSEGALRAGLRAQMRWSSAMVFVGAALAAYYYLNGNTVLGSSFLIAGAFSPFATGFGLSKSYLIGKQLFRESALLGLSRKLLPVLAVLAAVYLTQDVVTLVLVYFLSNTLSAGMLYALVVRRYRLPDTKEQDMVSYSKHLSALRIFSEIINQADKILVWVFLGAAPLAAYSLAQLPVTQLRQVFKLSSSLTFPKFSTMDFATTKKFLPHKVRVFLLVTVVVVVIYILLAPLFFTTLFPAYPESILLSQVLSLLILSKPRSLYGQVFTAHKMKRQQYITSISSNILKLVLLIVLLPLYGVWGAVYALLGTHLYLNIITRYLFAVAGKKNI